MLDVILRPGIISIGKFVGKWAALPVQCHQLKLTDAAIESELEPANGFHHWERPAPNYQFLGYFYRSDIT